MIFRSSFSVRHSRTVLLLSMTYRKVPHHQVIQAARDAQAVQAAEDAAAAEAAALTDKKLLCN